MISEFESDKESGRRALYSRYSEDTVESLHGGVAALFCQGLHDTFQGLKSMRSRGIFRALRHSTCDHGWTQDARGPIVGGLDARVRQEPQQLPPIMVPAHLVQQPLLVRIRQAAVPQGMGDRVLQALGLRRDVCHLPRGIRPPLLHRVLQQAFEPLPAITRPVFFRLQYITDRPQNMGQTLVLGHRIKRRGVITSASIRHHHALVVRRHDLRHLRVAMRGPDLGDGRRIRSKRHQGGGCAPDAPARVIGMDDGAHRHCRPQALLRFTDRARSAPHGVLRDGPLDPREPLQGCQHPGHVAHREPDSVVQRVGCCQRPIVHPVRRRPILVRRHVRMLATPLRATDHTPAHRHSVLRHLRARAGREISRIRAVDALLWQRSPTGRTRSQPHRDIHWGLGDLCRRGTAR